MDKVELKQILKPLIKQCIKEVIFEEGVLSGIISEVVKGTSSQQLMKESKPAQKKSKPRTNNKVKKQITEQKKKLLDAIGNNAYGGVDLFEGTKPLTNAQSGQSPSHSALSNVDPDDTGVDISNIPGAAAWKHLIK